MLTFPLRSLPLPAGLIGCSSNGYSSGSSWDGLTQAEQAAAQAGIDQVERIYNRDPIESASGLAEAAELEFFVAVDPSDPLIGVVRSAVDEPASDSDQFRWIPMVDATTFREVGPERAVAEDQPAALRVALQRPRGCHAT